MEKTFFSLLQYSSDRLIYRLPHFDQQMSQNATLGNLIWVARLCAKIPIRAGAKPPPTWGPDELHSVSLDHLSHPGLGGVLSPLTT